MSSINKLIITLMLLGPSFGHTQEMCGRVFGARPELSPQAKASLREVWERIEREAAAREAKAKEEAAIQQAKELEEQRLRDLAIAAELEGVKTLHDWNQISNEARLKVIEGESSMKNLPSKSSGEGRKDVRPGTLRVRINALKDPAQKAYAEKMLEFMKQNSVVEHDRGIYVEVITTDKGEILGGTFRHQANRNEYVEGYFDAAMNALKYDMSLQYDH